MSLLSKLFGGAGGKPAAEPIEYNGFSITPEPIAEGGQHRIAARIAKDGQEHHLIRADMFSDAQSAAEASVAKAKQMIDEQGEQLFR